MKLSFVLVLIAICTVVNALTQDEIDQEWEKFKIEYKRNYTGEEESFRKGLFTKTLLEVIEHNKKYDAGLVTYKIGINQFADMTDEEKATYTNGIKRPKK